MADLRIFLADDHAVVREGLKALINIQPGMAVCGEAGDGRTACEQVEQLRPDVVVMDVSLPELNGAQATERLKQTCPEVKVLALSVKTVETYKARSLEKLGLRSRADLVRFALQRGWLQST